jgi:hypothetical protein
MSIFTVAEFESKDEFPGANCQWCGDIGEFEDADGNMWPCMNGCTRPKDNNSTESA